MKYQVLGLILIASLTMGFSFGSKEKKKSAPAETAKAAQTQGVAVAEAARAQAGQTGQDVKAAVTSKVNPNANPKAAMKSANAVTPRAVPAAGTQEQFPTDLVSQLAAGDEATRKARMESLRRLSQALGQMNAPAGQASAAAPAQTAKKKK